MYELDQRLLDKARAILIDRPLYWLIGGSTTGKSTVVRALSEQTDIAVYDMDEQVFGHYQFNAQRHPATIAWFGAPNPLAFMLSLEWPDFNALYRAANAEYLDLMADDLGAHTDQRPLLVDGGITHPSVLAYVIPPERIVCLETTDKIRVETWEKAADRAEMRDSVLALPNGAALWQQFLLFDRRMAHTLQIESHQLGIPILQRDERTTVAETAAAVARLFGL